MALVALVVAVGFGLGGPVAIFWFRKTSAFDELGLYKFHRRFAVWEVVITARKFTFVGAIMFFSSRPMVAAVLALTVVLVSLVAQLWKRPFMYKQHNVLESILLCVAAVILIGVMFLARGGRSISDGQWMAIQVLVGLCFAFALLATITTLIWSLTSLEVLDVEEDNALHAIENAEEIELDSAALAVCPGPATDVPPPADNSSTTLS